VRLYTVRGKRGEAQHKEVEKQSKTNVTEITIILASTINSRRPRNTSGVRVDLVGMLMKSVISINTA
jgi:hypothetical protein